MTTMASDFTIKPSFIDFLKITMSSCSCKNLRTPRSIIKKVVNLMPPPVEALPAPMNMSNIINKRNGFVNCAMSTVLKPAVRVEQLGNRLPSFFKWCKSFHRNWIMEFKYKN